LPSFHGIQNDCIKIINELKTKLKERLDDQQSNPKVIAESVDLLLQLDEPPQALCEQYLSNSKRQLEDDLKRIESAAKGSSSDNNQDSSVMDAIEFVGVVCNGFLGNMSLVIQSCFDMFVSRKSRKDVAVVSHQSLVNFVQDLMSKCLTAVQSKLILEAKFLNSAYLARALDRLTGKLHTLDQMLPLAEINR
jgi:hypothetical protein